MHLPVVWVLVGVDAHPTLRDRISDLTTSLTTLVHKQNETHGSFLNKFFLLHFGAPSHNILKKNFKVVKMSLNLVALINDFSSLRSVHQQGRLVPFMSYLTSDWATLAPNGLASPK